MPESLLIPNSTQIPNVLLDWILPVITDAERSVMLYLVRRTLGFQRESDAISLEQFVHGMHRTGHTYDLGCGVSRRAVIDAMSFWEATGLVIHLEGGLGRSHVSVYQLNLKCELVQNLHLLEELENPREKIVQLLHPFRKGAKKEPFRSKKGANFDTHKYTKPRKLETKTTPPSPSRGRASVLAGFNEFWVAYPRKKNKGQAERAWATLHPDLTLRQRIMAALEEARRSREWLREDGQFIPYPATWIRAKGWEDQATETLRSAPNSGDPARKGGLVI